VPSTDVVALFVVPLEQLGLTYMVTGGVAAIAYGLPRLTNDVDVVLELGRADVDRILAAFAAEAFATPPREALLVELARPRGGHSNIIHVPSVQKADLYFLGDDALHVWAMARRRRTDVGAHQIWLAPAEYVIVRKLEWVGQGGSERHLRDVRNMLANAGPALDPAELERLVVERGLESLLERARAARD